MGVLWAPEETNIFAAIRARQASGTPLRRSVRGNLSWVQRYELTSILKGHHGCVNTIQWSPDATLLCSGSDDRCVNLWRLDKGNTGGTVSSVSTLMTMHRHNIFDAQLTSCQQRVISCGADGCVCLTQVEGSEQHRQLLYEPDAGHYLASKIAFMGRASPGAFLVTFGDGRIRMFDLRERDHRVAVDTSGVGLTGIELQPTNDKILAVGGNDPFLRLYDLRAITFYREDVLPSPGGAPTAAVSLHTTPALLHPAARHRRGASRVWSSTSDVGISGVSWSPNGRSLLANYRSSDVVLFDMSGSGEGGADASALARGRSTSDEDGAPAGGGPGVPASEYRAGLPQSAAAREAIAQFLQARDEFQLPSDRILLNAAQAYKGRVNEQTCAKEVRFLCGGAAVGTGGDCGSFFIWEAATGRLLRKLPADRCVVNCVAPHPLQPLVCTSGIDAEIKVWDVGDGRVRGCETRKRGSSEESGSSSDWGRRRREGAPSTTVAEAEERVRAAERHKQRGNVHVRQGGWAEALEEYRRALQELHFLAPNGETQRGREALVSTCHLNSALCHLSLEEYAAAAEDCTKVLESDEGSVKARFRRASALGELHEFERAFEDVDRALSAEPNNAEIKRLRVKLQAQKKQHQKRERSFYKRLLSCANRALE